MEAPGRGEQAATQHCQLQQRQRQCAVSGTYILHLMPSTSALHALLTAQGAAAVGVVSLMHISHQD